MTFNSKMTERPKIFLMVIYIVLWPCLLTTKLSCLQKTNFGHTISGIHHLATSHHAVVPGKTQCPICHSYFSKNTDLKRHIETVHEGQKTQCPTCQALFSRKTDLKRHIETVHEGKRTHCHLCSASFSRKTDLKRHVETVHEGKRTLCPNCSASFSRKTGLKQQH